MKLTPQEIETHCGTLLPAITRYITRLMGEEAATHTGGCLLDALRKYDGALGDIAPYARTKTRFLVVEACRSMDGRKGSAKYAARASQSSLEDFDGFQVEENPSERLEQEEVMCMALNTIGRAAKIQRLILFGRFLVGFTDKEIQRFSNVSQTKIWSEALSLRQLVSPR